VSANASSASNKRQNPSTNAADEISLAARLASFSEKAGATMPGEIRDAFRPADGWLSQRAPQQTIATMSPAEKFIAAHQLTAVSTSASGEAVAVVDGTLLRSGMWIDGYRLIAVDRMRAMFEATDGDRATLVLASAQAQLSNADR
jgi:hypothetical protein